MAPRQNMLRLASVLVFTAGLLISLIAVAALARLVWLGHGDPAPNRLARVYTLDPRHPSRWGEGAVYVGPLEERRSGYSDTRVYRMQGRMLLLGKLSDGRWRAVEEQNVF